MNRFFTSNSAGYRLLRTIIQGIIGVLIANLDLIVGVFHISAGYKALIVALVMAVLSPVMAMMGTRTPEETDDTELPYNYWEDNNGENDDIG